MGKGAVSLAYSLNNILSLWHMACTHFLKIMFHRESPPQRVFKYLNSLINFWESSCRNPPPWPWRKASITWGCVTWQLVFGLLGSFTSFRQSQIFSNRSSKFQHWWATDFFPWLLNLSDIWQDRKIKVFYFIFLNEFKQINSSGSRWDLQALPATEVPGSTFFFQVQSSRPSHAWWELPCRVPVNDPLL